MDYQLHEGSSCVYLWLQYLQEIQSAFSGNTKSRQEEQFTPATFATVVKRWSLGSDNLGSNPVTATYQLYELQHSFNFFTCKARINNSCFLIIMMILCLAYNKHSINACKYHQCHPHHVIASLLLSSHSQPWNFLSSIPGCRRTAEARACMLLT